MLWRALFVFLAAFASGRHLGAEGYALKVSVTANGPWIKAGEIVVPSLPEKLAALKIRRLDGPGKSVEIARDLVLLKFREARLKGAPITLSGTVCVVAASSRVVKGEDIRAFAEKYLKERLAPLSGSAEVEMLVKEPPRDLLVPDRSVRLDLMPPAGGRFRGNVLLRVVAHQALDDGSDLEVGQALISCLVKVRQRLLSATKPIRRGELISPLNSALSLADATFNQEEGYASFEEVAGLKAKTFIGADKLIAPSLLERPPVIKRGDIVKLMVKSGMVSVNVSAKAMRDAALGDSIPVEIVESKKQLQARVLDAGTVVSESR